MREWNWLPGRKPTVRLWEFWFSELDAPHNC
jgi:hypothetical protein